MVELKLVSGYFIMILKISILTDMYDFYFTAINVNSLNTSLVLVHFLAR